MEKRPYNILTISWDQTLAMDNPSFGDVQARNIEYGKYVNNIFSITYSRKNLNLKNKKLSENVLVYPTNSAHPLFFIFQAKKIATEICQENKIDLVLTQDPFLTGLVGVWVKKKFGCKLLIHYHGDFWHNSNWLKEKRYNPIFNILQRLVLRRADALRVMSEGQREKFIKSGWSEKRVRVISTPVDLGKFGGYENSSQKHKEQIESLINMQAGRRMILMVGRKDPVKDFDTLFKAVGLVYESHKNIGLWLVGNYGPADIDGLPLPEEIKNSGGVFISGNINSNDLPAYYKTSYLTVLSSTSESFGKVLVEANACGKPVVSTATTGAREIVQDGVNGFLVPIKDHQALADKIIYLLEHPDEAKIMGERGQQLMRQRFSDNVEKIIDFWHNIITVL